MKLSEHNPDNEAIIFIVRDDGFFEFVNPGLVPIKLLEDAIKEHKKRKPKKGEVSIACLIRIPNSNLKEQ